ncbi:hypothetical protein BBJ29_004512 [Phytophthora kernoviae]|uniref:Uncharacterized protein n=1 Tax=Phytophthora kernoviae TaxID=325452 RepID=A0A3F2RWL2_9STRA|nr:hypothetical protein BBJ29_004512 [Phytophthora kernoviae]RLN65627.1 hypothetical protein BBP00_00002733 [Phytophthora kernoviae]
MRSDFLRILFQWLLDGTRFTPDSSTTKPPTNTSNRRDEVRTRFDTYELHDFRFTRHDNYPKRHAFLIVTHGNRCIEDLAEFCAQSLEAYLEETNTLRRQRVEALTAQHVNELARETETPSSGAMLSRFMWHSVALDRLRGVIIGDVLSYRNNHGKQIDADQQQYKAIMACFIKHLAAFQQSSRCMNEASIETSPELPSGIPPLKLDVDNPDTLFLREQSSTEAGADISVEDTNIFPQPRWAHEEYKKTERARREVAEHVTVRGQAFWIIASCYETLEFFSIVDTALPLDLLEHEMNRLYAFGGAEPAEQPEDK